MALNAYAASVKSLLHDYNLQFYGSPFDMTGAINTARKRIAAEAQCVRVIPPSSGAITSISNLVGGSGYTVSPTITVAGSGSGAVLTPTVVGGVITNITITNGGSGYQPPLAITITDRTGTGASAKANVANILTTTANQEIYTFAAANSIVQTVSGVSSILGVLSVAVNQGAYKPVLKRWTWGQLQAYARSYNALVTNYPEVWAQYGQGALGSIYLYPIPSDTFGMDWDCYCLPVDLVDDSTPEAIPYPWTEAIPYYAAHLAYLNAQRADDAANMKNIYKEKMIEAGGFARPGVVPNYYGRRR